MLIPGVWFPLWILLYAVNGINATISVKYRFLFCNIHNWDAGGAWLVGIKSLSFWFLGDGESKCVKSQYWGLMCSNSSLLSMRGVGGWGVYTLLYYCLLPSKSRNPFALPWIPSITVDIVQGSSDSAHGTRPSYLTSWLSLAIKSAIRLAAAMISLSLEDHCLTSICRACAAIWWIKENNTAVIPLKQGLPRVLVTHLRGWLGLFLPW